MNETENLYEHLRANDPDYWKIDTRELDQSNDSELLNLRALENNTVVSVLPKSRLSPWETSSELATAYGK
jgi:hypothetical protein